jgi:hypothetical protein
MGIREDLNKRPKVAAGVTAVALVVVIGAMAMQLSGRGARGSSDRAFFTTDDGGHWFVDDADKLPPFQHDGKEAVRAYVFECNGKRFVNHLERFTPERRKLAETAAQATKAGQPPPPPPAAARQTVNWGLEVKKPGGKEWVAGGNLAKSSLIMKAKCPDGQDALPVEP